MHRTPKFINSRQRAQYAPAAATAYHYRWEDVHTHVIGLWSVLRKMLKFVFQAITTLKLQKSLRLHSRFIVTSALSPTNPMFETVAIFSPEVLEAWAWHEIFKPIVQRRSCVQFFYDA